MDKVAWEGVPSLLLDQYSCKYIIHLHKHWYHILQYERHLPLTTFTPSPQTHTLTSTLNQTTKCKISSVESQNQPHWWTSTEVVWVKTVCESFIKISNAVIRLFSVLINYPDYQQETFFTAHFSHFHLLALLHRVFTRPFQIKAFIFQEFQLYNLATDVFNNLASPI